MAIKTPKQNGHGGFRVGAGNKPYKPTKADIETVQNMVLAGIPHERIARSCGTEGISVPTLQKHFHEILDHYEQDMIGKVSKTMYQKAMAGDSTCMIFTLKCRGRWRENPVIEDALTTIVKRVIGVSDRDL
jgi:hypothetical protein